jgi:hypothetical protein
VDPIYVAKGQFVRFRVVKEPGLSEGWPEGDPIWTLPSGEKINSVEEEIFFNEGSLNAEDYKTISVTCGNTLTARIFVCSVKVLSADVTNDKIVIDLKGQVSGVLKIELIGTENTHLIKEEQKSGGTCEECFNIPNLSIGEYRYVRATWRVNDIDVIDKLPYHIQVLGNYHHTRYGTPDEAVTTCQGGATGTLCWTDGPADCVWNQESGISAIWLSQIDINANGYSSTLSSLIQKEGICTRPTGATCTEDNSFRKVTSITGSCLHEQLVANETVAFNRVLNPNLDCGDVVFIYGFGVKTVTDTGDHPEMMWLDHYIGRIGCTGVTDLSPSAMTIKFFND